MEDGQETSREMTVYVKKPEYPVQCTGMNGQCWFGGVSPRAFKAFQRKAEEAPPVGGVLHS